MSDYKDLFDTYIAKTNPDPYGFEFESSQGIELRRTDGTTMYDLTSGIAVNNVGHRHPKVLDAIKRQSEKYLHTMVYGEVVQEEQVLYARDLAKGLSHSLQEPAESLKVWFTNSGAEANETALKLAHLYKPEAKGGYIAIEGGFHGRTLGALGVSYRPKYRKPFQSLYTHNYCSFIPPDKEIKLDLNLDWKAVILEVVRGEDGVRPISQWWAQHVREWCTENDVLLIVDEVQTGFGRMGFDFGTYLYPFLKPDIVTLGKAVGGGLPLGAVVARRNLLNIFEEQPFTHLSTFGGNPLSCATGRAAYQVLQDEKLSDNAILREKQFRTELNQTRMEVRGYGLMLGLEFETPEMAEKFVPACWEEDLFVGYVLYDLKTIRMYPPLSITSSEVTVITEKINRVLEKI